MRFDETAALMGRTAARARHAVGRRPAGDFLLDQLEDQQVLTASDGGYGKRTRVAISARPAGAQGVSPWTSPTKPA